MKSYELTKDAEQDLREVARYTRKKWGNEILKEYRNGLKVGFDKIGRSEIKPRQFSNNFPELLVTKYRYHFIFYITKNVKKPVIIGVIHEKRDLVSRLLERLS